MRQPRLDAIDQLLDRLRLVARPAHNQLAIQSDCSVLLIICGSCAVVVAAESNPVI